MVFKQSDSSGNSGRPQAIARRVTMRPKSSSTPRGFMSAPSAPVQRSAPRPVYNPPPPAVSNSSGQYTSGGGGGGGNNGGGGGNDNSRGGGRPRNPNPEVQGKIQGPGTPSKPATPPPPSLKEYLNSDPTFQTGISELMKNLEQFRTSNKRSRQDIRSTFQTTMDRMNQDRTNALKSLQEDFASRGLLNSGLYTGAVSDYNDQYSQKLTDLTDDQRKSLQSLQEEMQQFRGTTRNKRQDLRLQAIRNRADKYGIKG